jgi:hypothetical protein
MMYAYKKRKVFIEKKMSSPVVPDKKPSAGKLTVVVIVIVIFLLGSILMLVFGFNFPNSTTGEAAQRNALLAIGFIVLFLTLGALIAYLAVVFKPESTIGRYTNQLLGY